MKDDLIRRQAVVNTVFSMLCRWDTEDPDDLKNMLLVAFQELPAADAVPVVRCRDCRFATWYDAADGVKRCFCDNHGSAGHTETDFCSYAEREETD